MFEFAQNYQEVQEYFPEERDRHKLPRQWIIDVMSSVIKEPFLQWVAEGVKWRNQQRISKNNLAVKVKSEILKIFLESSHVPSKKLYKIQFKNLFTAFSSSF
jgi:hypothetical protein